MAWLVGHRPSRSDLLVIAGFIRPRVLWRGLFVGRPFLSHWSSAVMITLSGLMVEPLAWLQSLLIHRQLRARQLPPDPIVVIGHWRSGTTYLHQLLASDPAAATVRNSLMVAPQVGVLLRPLILPLLARLMSARRPIDAVAWEPKDPQEDELCIAKLTIDTNMAGVAFPLDYLVHFRRSVLLTTRRFERLWLHVMRLTWLHDSANRSHLLIKNPAHTARVPMVLKHFPKARFIFLKREPIDSIRSLVQVKQRMSGLVGLQPLPSEISQVEDTVTAHRELIQAFEASRHLIPKGQLVEVAFSDLVRQPFDQVKRIYETFGLRSWNSAQAHIRQRIEQSSTYQADPVALEPRAEQRLRGLLGLG